MIEKRAAQRHRVFKGATIAFEGLGVACTVRNMSTGGAAIDLDSPVALPEAFTLSIACDHSEHRCHAVWRSNKRVGIAFLQ
ncbi:PilZ domain-containing protein [Bradyrhizobium sp.]|uniref:PilZ domain-containing protein n=1 Tax=Bradyrhizobium sp. TaxID=376 RepID=UPI0023866E1D|nr:PilZ domain-containing protein [Bradyrhizobium sp.]MDE2378706.1 PilZ domain-containing protein [Bradyrhizobium sp.]